jgi:hypothetical protein
MQLHCGCEEIRQRCTTFDGGCCSVQTGLAHVRISAARRLPSMLCRMSHTLPTRPEATASSWRSPLAAIQSHRKTPYCAHAMPQPAQAIHNCGVQQWK